jgi:hypothetical protein
MSAVDEQSIFWAYVEPFPRQKEKKKKYLVNLIDWHKIVVAIELARQRSEALHRTLRARVE